MLEMRATCERCSAALPHDAQDATICSYECTFCAGCAAELEGICPNCSGALAPRPPRAVPAS